MRRRAQGPRPPWTRIARHAVRCLNPPTRQTPDPHAIHVRFRASERDANARALAYARIGLHVTTFADDLGAVWYVVRPMPRPRAVKAPAAPKTPKAPDPPMHVEGEEFIARLMDGAREFGIASRARTIRAILKKDGPPAD